MLLTARRQFYRLRSRLQGNSVAPPLLQCWQRSALHRRNCWRQLEFLVVDTETSALNVSEGELLSIGWVVIAAGSVRLGSTRHILLKPRRSVGSSAAIHQLRDCELSAGISVESMMPELLQAAEGRVLAFHHAPMDLAFLNSISQRLYRAPLLLPWVDTLQLEKQSLERRQLPIGANALRLGSCRSRYNLPVYPAHNALMDALATAELLLAQLSHRGEDQRLGDLL
ncbi:3'-5' exonuclease [Pseudomaricurvus alkylphenolicus]|uniref:3'-5' exonuclease n=1 Tax=Pseudomaricurvus alkylphenolicus TaxID=1306991 RepID=UPI0014236CF9|nr:3'-5' exonuclease [Pseudomaricurvus alkylphenolicus]NIB40226.1 3'-5' exonuclease [Pseudomaricurvus alkylphenolicus]